MAKGARSTGHEVEKVVMSIMISGLVVPVEGATEEVGEGDQDGGVVRRRFLCRGGLGRTVQLFGLERIVRRSISKERERPGRVWSSWLAGRVWLR